VTVSEFRNGLLLTSSSSALPVGYTLPELVRLSFGDSSRTSLWMTGQIDDQRYETFYVRRETGGDEIIAVSVPELGIIRYVAGIGGISVFFALVFTGTGVVLLVARALGGRGFALRFRGRLLIALLVTAIVPLVFLTVYGRYNARERLLEETSRNLEEETATVVMNVRDQVDDASREEGLPVITVAAEAIAADLGTDFNLYIGSDLVASSRPELYDIGILDRRMSGNAYAGVMIGGRRFHLETESIGRYQYAVGYRPVLDNAGAIIGIVSVPTLFRQDELEEEIARRNALYFGVYMLVLFTVIVIATAFAHRIAAPIQELTEATKRVARGDLNVRVDFPAAEGEIGELVRSFDRMTKDLQRSREELIRYERELAWKEMAKQVAHEIKNPLTPMRLAVQHLGQTYKDRVQDFDQVLEAVTKTVLEQIDTLSKIASEFSHFARMPKRQLERCDINSILSESVGLFSQHSLVRFEVLLAEDLPPVLADREELRRAFINVIRNSIQAMDAAGTIGVTTGRATGGISAAIRDSGPGIPDEMRGKLFQPNFSTKTDGMGLGLAIVKKTVDDLGGSITVDSTPGRGTTVTIVLPAMTEG
jgi:nitrogen fixation/metabolism regulation signal transduction histidine kinase